MLPPASMSLTAYDVDLEVDGRGLPGPGLAVGDDAGQDHAAPRRTAAGPRPAAAAGRGGRGVTGDPVSRRVHGVEVGVRGLLGRAPAPRLAQQVGERRARRRSAAGGARAGGRPPGRRPRRPRRARLMPSAPSRSTSSRAMASTAGPISASAGSPSSRLSTCAARRPRGCARGAAARCRGRRPRARPRAPAATGSSPATTAQKTQLTPEPPVGDDVLQRLARGEAAQLGGDQPVRRAARTPSWPRRRAARSSTPGICHSGWSGGSGSGR